MASLSFTYPTFLQLVEEPYGLFGTSDRAATRAWLNATLGRDAAAVTLEQYHKTTADSDDHMAGPGVIGPVAVMVLVIAMAIFCCKDSDDNVRPACLPCAHARRAC